MKKRVSVIGLGMSPRDLTEEHLERIRNAEILIGGRRHLDYFPDVTAEKLAITRDIKGLSEYIRTWAGRRTIVVLASGDPMFHGIGPTVVRAAGSDRVDIFPNVTSVAAAFARIRETWNDAVIISLHGQNRFPALLDALERSRKVAVLTDPGHSPAWLAAELANEGMTDVNLCVLERLGQPDEKVRWFTPTEAADEQFADPNLVILNAGTSRGADPSLHLGMPDDSFAHENGLITKSEVRAITLARLRLASHHVLWDLGAGSGSVGIEAAVFIRTGRIIAVERRAERIDLIRENRSRFKVRNLEIVQADLPAAIEELPAPDRIFIGGGGRKLPDILDEATSRLKPGGILVVNTVLLPSFQAACSELNRHGFTVDVLQVQINRGRAMPWGDRLDAQNPVWIVTGEKPHI